MAGLRHHHIPQCLLRGWSSIDGANGERVRLFRRHAPPILCSTKDVAVGTRFYSDTIDLEITKLETILGPIINALRHEPIGAPVSPQLAETLIVHLAMRSGFVRSEIERMLGELIAGVGRYNGDPEFMPAIIKDVEKPGFGEGLLEFMQARLAELPPNEQTDDTRAWASDRGALVEKLRQAAATPSDFTDSLNDVVATLGGVLDIIARNVHLQLVGDTLGAKTSVPALHDFQWSMIAFPDDHLILPDCVAIWVDENGAGAQSYIFSSLTAAPIVVLPVSSRRLLIGRRTGASAMLAPDKLNQHLAACARSLYVAHPGHDGANDLAPQLGSSPNALDLAIAPALTYLQR